jgi:predicted nucleic acid-binding protein
MKIKIDACSLIYLQKLDLIPHISRNLGDILITDEVYNEVINRGLEKGQSDAMRIKEQFDMGLIKQIEARGVMSSFLDIGEAQTLAEVKIEKDAGEKVVFISDDKKAKKEAIRNQVDMLGVDSLLVELYLKQILSADEFDEKILTFDTFHKLDLIRITELRRFIRIIKEAKNK